MRSSDATFSDLVGGIYDAVIEPARWHDAIDSVRTAFAFENAVVAAVALPRGVSILQLAVNIPDDFVHRITAYNDEILELWGGPAHVARLPLEEPFIQSQVTDPATWSDNAYYRDWGAPQGLTNAVAIGLARDSSMVANVAFGKHGAARPITASDVGGLRQLAPHLRRAVTISRILDTAASRAGSLEAMLDASDSGALLVDANLRILHANRAAEKMLADGDPIRSTDGCLELRTNLVPGQLETAVSRAAGHEARLGRKGLGVPSRRRDGSPVVINVMPLEQRSSRIGGREQPAAAIFVSPRPAGAPMVTDAAGLLFGLTPAEAGVFEMIVAGRSNDEMATALGIASSTLKTHILRVFDKTGRHRRADLIKLVSEMGIGS